MEPISCKIGANREKTNTAFSPRLRKGPSPTKVGMERARNDHEIRATSEKIPRETFLSLLFSDSRCPPPPPVFSIAGGGISRVSGELVRVGLCDQFPRRGREFGRGFAGFSTSFLSSREWGVWREWTVLPRSSRSNTLNGKSLSYSYEIGPYDQYVFVRLNKPDKKS